MPVVGTAGHVDHGKSTLTLALSGRDPDRWAEEKERGLTIDLGFAWTTLDDGTEISFVDVPGHERYAKNMLAGIEAIDVALLVVAADEGWMPQSEEHLAVLDLLEVEHAVVALAKVDKVDDDLRQLATLEIEEQLAGTTLEGSPVVAVSAVTGEGLDDLRRALSEAVDAAGTRDVGRPRMWVDRSFSATGAGTVVTGTLLEGQVHVDDRLTLFPDGLDVRIRSIQSHETPLETALPQRRVALNLGGISTDDVRRGSMVGRNDQWRTTDRIAATVRSARYAEPITGRGAFHIHVGSGAWPVRLRVIDDGVVFVDLPSPLALTMGDRFVLRDTGRRRVVAGGRVLDPHPKRPKRILPHITDLRSALDEGPDARATALLAVRGTADVADLSRDSGGGTATGGVEAGPIVLQRSVLASLTDTLVAQVDAYHRAHPLRAGLPAAEAASKLGIDAGVVTTIVDSDDRLSSDGAVIRSASFRGDRSDEDDAAWARAREELERSGAASAPRAQDLGLGDELLHALVREGELVRIAGDLVLLPGQVETLVAAVGGMSEPFTVSEFKDVTGLSRKYAVPFLEWADANGHTVRMGDRRRAR